MRNDGGTMHEYAEMTGPGLGWEDLSDELGASDEATPSGCTVRAAAAFVRRRDLAGARAVTRSPSCSMARTELQRLDGISQSCVGIRQ